MNKKLFTLTLVGLLASNVIAATPEAQAVGQSATEITFPDIKDSYLKQAPLFDTKELSHITNNSVMHRDVIRARLGSPHFSEFMSDTWNYFFDVRAENQDGYMTCQLRLDFDKDDKTSGQWWKPAACENFINQPTITKKIQISDVTPVPKIVSDDKETTQPLQLQRFNLETDNLFEFNSAELNDTYSEEVGSLNNIIEQLLILQKNTNIKINISGHTDHIGSEMYNLILSNQRAQSVRTYFIDKGIEKNSISINGLGEVQPIQECDNTMPRNQLIDCLKPNRRVTVEISGVF